MMYLALTYDHRLLDGREAVVFLVKVSSKLFPAINISGLYACSFFLLLFFLTFVGRVLGEGIY